MNKFRGLFFAIVAAVIALGFSASPAHAATPNVIIDICVRYPQLCVDIELPGDDNPDDEVPDEDDPWV
ncbi:hypothetical protein ACTMTI_35505 [Nonomuraea sp. H19]|uniref:hypothetical protein n=1 Tax=Nonomuraea sp. H19 TaxID=3452206 RepID=UPI003F88DB1A